MLAIGNTTIKETNSHFSDPLHSIKVLAEEIQQFQNKLFQNVEHSKIICLGYKGSSIQKCTKQ